LTTKPGGDATVTHIERREAKTYDYDQHPLSKRYPPMSDEQFEGLIHSIHANGIREPIMLFEGKVLDGWHRYTAGKEASHPFKPEDFKQFDGTYEQAKAYVDDKNAHRRHLTTAQKQDWIKVLVKENPNASDREIGRLAGVHHNTVRTARDELRPKEDRQLDNLKKTYKALNEKQRNAFVEAFKDDLRPRVKYLGG
jgi:hypothetical protein